MNTRRCLSKYWILLIITYIPYFHNNLQGQHLYDKHWIISNYIHFNFDSNDVIADIIDHPNGLITGPFNTAISSSEGDLLFHTSGCFILDRNSNIMDNGDSINISANEFGYCKIGDAIWYQDVIILPYPGSLEKYILFNLDIGAPFPPDDTMYYSLVPLKMLYHLVDMGMSQGMGKVISKNNTAISDTLTRAYVQASRHANGRDWWVVIPEWNSNCYYVLLFDINGIYKVKKECSGPAYGDYDIGAQVAFSSDGNWYARSVPWGKDTIGRLNLYSFDRCTGELIHKNNLVFPVNIPYYTGLSFSPNNQNLYVSSYKSLWQFSLGIDDIQSSILLAGEIEKDFTAEKGSLYYHQLSPSGKIYIASPLGHKYLSTIHFPNKIGLECGFKEHDFAMPLLRQNYAGLSNYPNYKLGPSDSTNCDSLGIDNIPVAKFTYRVDSPNPRQIVFSNLSYFEPDSFIWDFDDGNESSEAEPVHLYTEDGNYKVCLTALNSNGADTFCQQIMISTISVDRENKISGILLYPQPANDILGLDFGDHLDFPLSLNIYNSISEKIYEQDVYDDVSIDTNTFPDGIYILMLTNNGLLVFSRQFVIQH